jgi:uncharacterized glyoxalase superfamily protein PhnB
MTNIIEAPETAKTATKTSLTPHITCRNAVEAVEFYKKAFGAEALGVVTTPEGKVMHAALSIDGATFYIVDEFPEHGGLGPQSIGGTPVTLHLQVSDCDAVYAKAVEEGCTSVMPLADMFWGDRWGLLTDPYGHSWSVATTVREMSQADLQEAVNNMDQTCCGPDANPA